MSKKQFTPGPWIARGEGGTSDGGSNKQHPCFNGMVSAWNSGQIIVQQSTLIGIQGKTPKEAEANARLIAAAPEMYELLEAVLPYLKAKGTNGNHHVEKIDSLLNSITNG